MHRSLRFCRHLREFGWNPIVLTTGDPSQNTSELIASLPDSIVVDRLPDGHPSGNKVTSTPAMNAALPLREPSPSGILSGIKNSLRPILRLIQETPDKHYAWAKKASVQGAKLALQHHAQIVFSSGPPHSTHLAALAVSKQIKIPLVVDFRDPWGRKPWKNHDNPLRDYVLPWYENKVVRHANQVILNTDTSLEDFRKHYPNQLEKFSCIPNGLDSHLIEQVDALQKSPSLNAHPVFIHPGNLYGHRDPVPLIKAIAKLKDQGVEVQFRQIGSIDPHYKADELVKDLGLQALVSIESPMPHPQVLQAMRDSDALVIIQPDAPFMVPAKVFEMMAFEQPILSVSDSPCTESIVESSGGACASSRDVDAIAAAIKKVLAMLGGPQLHSLRTHARKTYDAKTLTSQLANRFDSAIQ
ncbi:MAG: glycosyltransferase [Planctomycetes bacterium]|nr:glycosyltransferase [Planctomycetota bacterium]